MRHVGQTSVLVILDTHGMRIDSWDALHDAALRCTLDTMGERRMPNYWTYLNEANRQLLRLDAFAASENPVACAMLLRQIRRQLALRFEKRSLVFVDDDSQQLYDRWEEREVWAWVPTLSDPVYDIEGVGKVSPREVSWLRRADAFSLDVPIAVREAGLGTLTMLRRRIEVTLLEGTAESEHALEVLVAAGSSAARDTGLEQVMLPLGGQRGVALIYGDGACFRGGIDVVRDGPHWRVTPVDQIAGIAAGDKDSRAVVLDASPCGDDDRRYYAHGSSVQALGAVRKWIDDKLRDAEVRRDGMPKYDVAISFAGEDRESAEEIAARLTLRGYRVFYDAYEQAALWGKDLYQHLASIYTDQAVFCVILISRHYRDKLWTRHELRSAQARAFRESQEYILPVALDDTRLPGMPETIGYVRLSEVGHDGLVALLCEKLEASS